MHHRTRSRGRGATPSASPSGAGDGEGTASSSHSPVPTPTPVTGAADASTHRGPAATLVAGRYELGDLVGTGGASRVHAALDLVTGGTVAVKLLRGGPASDAVRVHREISALRLLRLPGVVALLDEGTHEGQRFLVMDLVKGRPFPGTAAPAAWETLAPVVIALLEVLARVHAAGVVHRDLKPSNVLVGDDGRVTVLDFGVSWGPALGEALTSLGTIVGTPEFLAPEQFVGAMGDARTDLYALGVMLYQALTGRATHEATDFADLVRLRRSKMPVPVRIVAPRVPRDVAGIVDQLLAMDPDDRPQSAGEALQSLFGLRPAGSTSRKLPRLGGDDAVRALVRAGEERRSADVLGPPGSGRSRLLAEAADRLAALGRTVFWVVPGSAPYASVAPLVGGLDELRDASPAEVAAIVRGRLEEHLRAGTVVVADDAERTDRWSAAAIEACRAAGSVFRVAASPAGADVRLAELTEEDLRALFAGPDRIFHFREDGARELWRRTGGLPARIAAEIAAWVRAGVAHWDGAAVVVRRDALDRLRGGQSVGDELLVHPGTGSAGSPHLDELLAWIAFAWPYSSVELLVKATGEPRWSLEPGVEALAAEGMVRRLPDGTMQPLVVPRSLQSWPPERRRAAHHAMSVALAPGTPLRLRHLAAAGEPEEVVDEALLLAPELVRQGRNGEALVVLEEGLSAARRTADRDREGAVLAELAKTCLAVGSPHALDRGLYEMSRAAWSDTTVKPVEQLLRGARKAAAGDPAEALAVLAAIPPFDDLDLELWRHGQRMRAARRLTAEHEHRVLRDVEEWAQRTGHVRALASLAAWRALHLQKERRHADAAKMHLEAARHSDRVPAKMASHLNAGLALLDGGRLEESRAAALACRSLAAACRNAFYEAHAEALLRTIAYRLGDADAVDGELVEAAAVLGHPDLEESILMTEAAVAWRAGLLHEAGVLVARCTAIEETAGNPLSGLLAEAMELVCGASHDAETVAKLAAEARQCGDAETAVQVLGLLALVAPARAPELRRDAAGRAAELGDPDPDRRGQVLSLREVLHGLA